MPGTAAGVVPGCAAGDGTGKKLKGEQEKNARQTEQNPPGISQNPGADIAGNKSRSTWGRVAYYKKLARLFGAEQADGKACVLFRSDVAGWRIF